MLIRARHLFLAWLALGTLQLALLGAGGMADARPEVGARSARPSVELHSPALGKRFLVADATERRVSPAPFAPSVPVRLDLATPASHEAPAAPSHDAVPGDRVALPPARAPPALS